MKKVVPAILAKNLNELDDFLAKVQGITDWVHVDIMDGVFVQNVSVTLEDISKSKLIKFFSVELHLMVQNPQAHFSMCQTIGAKRVIMHLEAGNTDEAVSEAKKAGFEAVLAVNPESAITGIEPYMDTIDGILLMSVKPGFQGQIFMLQTLDKMRTLRDMHPMIPIEVDGGVNVDTIASVSRAGANIMMVGSGLFGADDIKKRFEELNSKI